MASWGQLRDRCLKELAQFDLFGPLFGITPSALEHDVLLTPDEALASSWYTVAGEAIRAFDATRDEDGQLTSELETMYESLQKEARRLERDFPNAVNWCKRHEGQPLA